MTAQYKYDPFGRRIEKNINGTITRYLYDNEDILFELDTSNNILAAYVHGPGIDEPIAITNGTSHYYHTDGLGSIIAITDSSGNVVQHYEYDSFGNITYQQDPNYIQPYTYTAREYDPESGLYYYRARYYDAKIGRFISEDPIGLLGGINKFIYVENNPVNWVDPMGLLLGGPGAAYRKPGPIPPPPGSCAGQWKQMGSEWAGPWCSCYWICMPCNNPVIWSGNYRRLPATSGKTYFDPKDSRYKCACEDEPSPDSDCNKCEKK